MEALIQGIIPKAKIVSLESAPPEKISKKPVTGQLEYEFVDNSAPYESAKYWLYELSSSGRDSWHGPAFLSPYLQRIVFALFTVYPNPFNAHTEIKYSVPQPSFVQLTIFDSQGKMVRRLVNKQTKAGINTTSWDGTNENGARVSSGVYFLRLNAGKKVLTRKMIMLK